MTDKRLIQISHDLRAEAQNEHMVDQHFTALGKFLNEAANRILEVLGTGLNGRTIYDARIAVEAPSPREVALTTFAREVLQCAFEGNDYDGGGAQERAAELGLLTRTTYDPEKHGEHDFCEPGDDFYVFSDWLSPAQKGEGG